MFDCGRWGFAPRKGSVASDEDSRNGEGIEVALVEKARDNGTGVANVGLGNFLER